MKNTIHNKDLFQNIFEASAEGIMALDEDGLIIFANSAGEKLFGYQSDELIGKNFIILISEKLKQQYKGYFKNQLKGKEKGTDIWGIKKDGFEFSLNIALSPTIIESKNGTIVFLSDATQHIIDLKTIAKTNAELIESNRTLDALINNQKGIVFRCKNNENYEMDFISKGCFIITGYPLEDFKNRNIFYGKLILEEDREYAWETLQSAVDQKRPFSIEYRIKHKNGNIKYVWEQGSAVYNDQNEVVALEGFISDITPQKETELELHESQAKIKALLEAIPDIMLIQNREGIYLDLYANDPKDLIIPKEEFIGKDMSEVLSSHVYQIIKLSHKNVIESGTIQIVEFEVPGKNGIQQFEARVVLMNDHNLLTIVRNITEGTATNAQLNIKNNALASASNSIVIVDAQQPDTPIIYCNKAFEIMTGYSNEEILGRNSQFLHKDDRDQKEIRIMDNAIAKGEACNVIVRNYRKDGTLFWNDVTITPIYDEEKRLTHFIGVQNDITNKVKETKLRDQAKKILELITQNRDLETIGKAIVKTVEARLEDCTASILLLGVHDHKLRQLAQPNLPKEFCDYIEDTAMDPQLSSCSGTAARLKKEVIISNIETDILSEDHKEIALKNGVRACWSFPILSSVNEVLGTFNVYSPHSRKPLSTEKEIILNLIHLASIAIENHRNIIALRENKRELEIHSKRLEERVQERTHEVMATVQKLVETNLNLEDQLLITEQIQKVAMASKALTSEIAKNFPKGLIVVINKDLKVEFVEGQALDFLDLRQTIYEGLSIDDVTLFSTPRKILVRENILKTLSGQHLTFETKFKKSYFSINTTPLFDENNEIVSALHVYNDITSQKEIEFNFQNAFKKERELNDLKSRFISLASHEFRTPLSAILTSAILIGKKNENGKEEKREKYLNQIERNVNHLVVILNDFLSLGKLDEGKVIAMRESFDLIQFSKALVKETNIGLKKGQTVTVSNSIETLPVTLDPKLMRHVLMNLLNNASKYSPEGSNISLKISKKHENVLIKVKDKGMGIPEEEQSSLFQRFFRATNAANIEGTGLGLNIVKNYTELMGGTIEFKSKINNGTTFTVEFPIHTK